MAEPMTTGTRAEALYDRIRAQIEHENDLYNHRIVWLITMQAFLFATTGLVVQAKLGLKASNLSQGAFIVDGFSVLLSIVGIMVALIADQLLTNSRRALNLLRKTWEDRKDRVLNSEADLDLFPPISGGEANPRTGTILRSGNLPKLFVLSWVVVELILLSDRLGALADGRLFAMGGFGTLATVIGLNFH
ncbi:MAG: hypothetical protein WDM86_23305 [Rhizomicrobium sp.]